MAPIEILAQQNDADLADFASFLNETDQATFWNRIHEARNN